MPIYVQRGRNKPDSYQLEESQFELSGAAIPLDLPELRVRYDYEELLENVIVELRLISLLLVAGFSGQLPNLGLQLDEIRRNLLRDLQ